MNRIYYLFLFCCCFLYSQEEQKSIVVLFNSNEFTLTPETENILIPFFSDENIVVSTISVHGFCDDIGSVQNNLILSKNRAQSVSNFLKHEFNLSCNSVIGIGELPLLDKSSVNENRKNNRKVILEITFSKKKEEKFLSNKESENRYKNYKTFSDNLVVGDKIIIKNLLFKGSLRIFENPEEALIELDKIVKYLNENPNTSIEIQGHVCCIGNAHSDAHDRFSGKNNLSHTRAQKVFENLIEKGISPTRMTHMGFGRKFPILGGLETENKRVEILITKI